MDVMKMKGVAKYERYKDSGENWMGEIPKHWQLRRMKFVLKTPLKYGANESGIEYSQDLPRYIRITDFSANGLLSETKKLSLPVDIAKNYLLADGDILFARSGATVGKSYQFKKSMSIESQYSFAGYLIKASPDENIVLSDFLFYYTLSGRFEIWKNFIFNKATIENIGADKYADLKVILPPLPEQIAIAAFLDEKTAKIDQAIAQKEQLIALLKERKQILIQELVTGKKVWSEKQQKWIDSRTSSEVEMVDSGVEWIGEIPKGWEVKKLFGVSRFLRGNSTFSKDELLTNGEYVALQYGKSYKVSEVDEKYEFYVNNEFYKDSQVVNYGDTIFISTSETIEDLGHSVFYKRNDLGLLGGEQMLIKPKSEKVTGKYLHFSSKIFSKELRKYATGIKVFRFNINDLKTIYTPVPLLDEQNIIVQQLDLTLNKIEQAIIHQQTQITKLKEYKSVLIDSAVTGKIKVC